MTTSTKRPDGGELSFQKRVLNWLMECFSNEVCRDGVERNHRFLEESLELVQSLGCTRSEAHQLVDYVFGRPVGEPFQELGGVMVTMSALASCHDMDFEEAAETELARVWTKIEKIRAKQLAKPKHSPLPDTKLPVKCNECGCMFRDFAPEGEPSCQCGEKVIRAMKDEMVGRTPTNESPAPQPPVEGLREATLACADDLIAVCEAASRAAKRTGNTFVLDRQRVAGFIHGRLAALASPSLTAGASSELRRVWLDRLNAIAPAVENLACHQEQCDFDGVMVKVSRQALDEVLNAVNDLAVSFVTAPATLIEQSGQKEAINPINHEQTK